ncbi:hypothetical protein lerEdw1_010184 [Lerista edwardsae]|nr:hypothetical protein lerEdw1_010184 [Lerista edwardsae]
MVKSSPMLGASSDVQLVSSGPGIVRPGENLNLVCKVTGSTLNSQNSFWHWIRQPFNKGLNWIGRGHYQKGAAWKTEYASAFSSWVSISASTSKNEYYLQLNSLTDSDTATYFCARKHSDTNPDKKEKWV